MANVNVTSIEKWIRQIQELTSSNTFDVSAELLECLRDLRAASNYKTLTDDIITKINSLHGADVLVRIVSILSKREVLTREEGNCLESTYCCINNLSEKGEFARSAANTCIIEKCIENLKDKERYISKGSRIDENTLLVIKRSLAIIHNISKEKNIKSFFDKDMSILQRYKKSENEDFMALSVMILVYLSNDESDKIQDEKETALYLVGVLKKAINDRDGRAMGYSSTGLLEGLAHLALNEKNKLTIAKEVGVSLLMKLVQSDREKEQVAAAHCLWTLAFLPMMKTELQTRKEKLETFSKSCHNKALSKNLQGILLTIAKPAATIKEKNRDDGHIMISYAWDNGYGQDAARKIAAYLKSRGLKVWIDTDKMKGSLLVAMAQAVDDSYAVVLCASDKYRTSNNCRMEAVFANELHKRIIPVVVGSSIECKNDWLRMLCAGQKYVDFTNESEFHKKCEELVKEIDGVSSAVYKTDVVAENVSEFTSPPNASKSVAQWSPCDVKKWLSDQALQCFEDEFEDFNGRSLIRLIKMQRDAPEVFYRYICEQKDGKEKRKLNDVLKLTEAIETISIQFSAL